MAAAPERAPPVTLTIALDAMGGDHAPQVVIGGADMARERFPDLRFTLHGDKEVLQRLLQARPQLASRCEIEHTPERVDPDARPSQVLRQGRGTSMCLAIEAVKAGRASAAVSAGENRAFFGACPVLPQTPPPGGRA